MELTPADAVICLGHSLAGPSTIRDMNHRVDRAVDLIRGGHGRSLLLTGGRHHSAPPRKPQSEAAYMRDRAISLGVQPGIISLEEQSRTTVGNAEFSRAIVRQHGWTSAIVVTSDYHLRRARYIFSYFMPDVQLQFAAAPSSLHGLAKIRKTIIEWYFLWHLKRLGFDRARR